MQAYMCNEKIFHFLKDYSRLKMGENQAVATYTYVHVQNLVASHYDVIFHSKGSYMHMYIKLIRQTRQYT